MLIATPLIFLRLTQPTDYQAEQFSLRATPVLGRKRLGETGFKMSVKDRSFSGLMKVQSEVTKLLPDGGFESTSTRISGEVTIEGERRELPPSKPETITYDKNQNPVVTPRPFDVGDPVPMFAELLRGHDPVEPKRFGEKWDVQSRSGSSSFTLVGREKLGDHPCFKIKVDARLAAVGAKADVTGTIFLRESDRTTEKVQLSTSNYMVERSNGSTLSVEFWLRRLP